MNNKYSLAIHGGAGTILKSKMSPEQEATYKAVLEESLAKGQKILAKGGNSLDAVEVAVTVLEDSHLFNAGKGAVFTADGKHEMEASIMCGKTLEAGAVAGITTLKNPVTLARKILEDNNYVFLSGNGAEEYGVLHKLETVTNDYFYSDMRYEQWQALKGSDKTALDHTDDRKFGTVGAVALDRHGNIAAATSTGGLTNKKYGRIGDSSVIGSGVYANNDTCAISCTGYGEFFLRGVVAYDISCLMEYGKLSLQQAADKVIMEKQTKLGGEGGIVGVDAKGNIALVFNSEGMYRGMVSESSSPKAFIFNV
ncbi:MAG: isoaspartyl peptidase/L-asparaginase [Fulvivirga sp.]|uniref:isoaspartyl peptidase/L-asparaginase family protein n=1 Tax=Fulvivirga sp. TaxID=1931237 RepID=UPI0032EBAB73